MALGTVAVAQVRKNIQYSKSIDEIVVKDIDINIDLIRESKYMENIIEDKSLGLQETRALTRCLSEISQSITKLDYMASKVHNIEASSSLNLSQLEPSGIFTNAATTLTQLYYLEHEKDSEKIEFEDYQVEYLEELYKLLKEYRDIDNNIGWVKYLVEIRKITKKYENLKISRFVL